MTELTEAERAWPYAGRELAVGKVQEIGDNLRLGVIRVWPDEQARVQVWPIADQSTARFVTLPLGVPVPCFTRTVRLVETGHDGQRPWIKVVAS